MKGKVGQKGKYLIAQRLIFSGFYTQHSAYNIAAMIVWPEIKHE